MRVRISVELDERDYEFERENRVENADPDVNARRAQQLVNEVVQDIANVLGTTPGDSKDD